MKGEKAVKGFEKLPDFLLFTLPVRDVKSPFGIFLGINFDSENFSSFAKFAFQNKRPLLQHSFRPSDGSTLPDRLSLKADPSASVNFNPSFKYS